MPKTSHKYNVSTLEMLLTAQTISSHFANQIDKFKYIQKWTPEFAEGLQSRIANALDELIGADHKKEQRKAASDYHSKAEEAKEATGQLKKLIDVFLKKDAKEIKKRLGYTKYWDSTKTSQKDFIGLLISIRKELGASMRNKLTAAGITEELLDKVIAYSAEVQALHNAHEQLKVNSREGNHAAQAEYDAIYEEIIGISQVSATLFKGETLMLDRFVFNRVSKRIAKQAQKENKSVEEFAPSLVKNAVGF